MSTAYYQQPREYPFPVQPIRQSGQYTCLYPRCSSYAFSRKADLERHIGAIHARETLQLVSCEYPGCHRVDRYGFSRKDKMVGHMREVHKCGPPKRQPGQQQRKDSMSPTSNYR